MSLFCAICPNTTPKNVQQAVVIIAGTSVCSAHASAVFEASEQHVTLLHRVQRILAQRENRRLTDVLRNIMDQQ